MQLETKVVVLGAGYVGLPLAIHLSDHYKVVCFDIDRYKIENLINGLDTTGELDNSELEKLKSIQFTSNEHDLKFSDIFIVTVPTPIDHDKQPDLNAIEAASQLIAKYLKKGSLVIYESTVYPGVTEEVCVPILESSSKLILNEDFYVGYSPERINPGDKKNKLTNINKIVSGSNSEALKRVKALYSRIINADLYEAKTIKVAEAAKVIENIQRDVNIALMNELAISLNYMGVSIYDTLEAAKTKWNFIDIQPGLVGGHCIGVDPYYLIHKSRRLGYETRIISAARETSDNFGGYVASRIIKETIKRKLKLSNLKILVLGYTFKENCNDTRNTRTIDVVNSLT